MIDEYKKFQVCDKFEWLSKLLANSNYKNIYLRGYVYIQYIVIPPRTSKKQGLPSTAR